MTARATTARKALHGRGAASTAWGRLCHGVTRAVSGRDTNSVRPRHEQCQAVTLSRLWLLAAMCLLLLSSCDDRKGLLPPSGGRLYEVLLVGDTDNIVRNVLQADVPGLPQAEPQFDVSGIGSSRFNQAVSVARNIVMVSVDSRLHSAVSLSRERDVWAQPQMVVRVNAPSAGMLRDSIGRIAPALLNMLNRSEMNKSIVMLRQKRNTKAEKLVRQMFGIDMWVPVDMTSSKRGKNFLWLGSSSPTVMRNIVIYKGGDSVLQANIKGETDSMHFRNVAPTMSTAAEFKQIEVSRGLWEMTGDDMGGPFVRREAQGVSVEAFVFAPGKKKRNAIKQLEAALYTIRH